MNKVQQPRIGAGRIPDTLHLYYYSGTAEQLQKGLDVAVTDVH